MKILALVPLLFLPVWAAAQSGEEEEDPQSTVRDDFPQGRAPGRDSAEARIAVLAVAKADAEAAATSFLRRLVPSVTIGGTIGLHDLMFPETGGVVVFPKDSYRITATLSLSGLLDGSKHALALIAREEAEARLALLIRKQESAREALRRKALQVRAELSALEEELLVWRSLAAYQEVLFTQGRVDFRAVARARVDGIRLRGAVARASVLLRAVEEELEGGERK